VYTSALADLNSSVEQDEHLVSCYRTVFNATTVEVKTGVAKHFYKVCRSKDEATVLIYENKFFRASDMTFLSESERTFVKTHFLARIFPETILQLLDNLRGIGPFLDHDEAYSLCFSVVAVECDDTRVANKTGAWFLSEYRN